MDIDISLLILNAGVIHANVLEKSKPKDIQATIDVNMYHPTMLLKVILPRLLRRYEKKEYSGIIILSSVAGRLPIPANISYSASKAYTRQLGEAVEFELKKYKEGKVIDV